MPNRDSSGRFISGSGGGDPVIAIGGDPSGAVDALKTVRQQMGATAATARATGGTIKSAFSGLGSVFSGLWASIKFGAGLMGKAWGLAISALNKVKWAVLGVTGALAASYYAWDKEAKAQSRLDSLLKANVRNYKAAGVEVNRLIGYAQKFTNFGDDAVRGVFGAFMQVNKKSGFGNAQKLLPSILDLSAARGMEPEGVAEAFARAIATGNTSMLRRQGIIIDPAAFKRNPIGAIQQTVGQIAPGAAMAERQAAPLSSLLGNLHEVLESVGKVISVYVTPAVERLSRMAQRAAEALGDMNAKEAWGAFKEYALAAWKLIAAAGTAFFSWLTPKIPELVQSTMNQIKAFFNSEFATSVGGAIATAASEAVTRLLPPALRPLPPPGQLGPGSQRHIQSGRVLAPQNQPTQPAPMQGPQSAPALGVIIPGMGLTMPGWTKPVSAAQYYSPAVNAAIAAQGGSGGNPAFHYAAATGGAPSAGSMWSDAYTRMYGQSINDNPLMKAYSAAAAPGAPASSGGWRKNFNPARVAAIVRSSNFENTYWWYHGLKDQTDLWRARDAGKFLGSDATMWPAPHSPHGEVSGLPAVSTMGARTRLDDSAIVDRLLINQARRTDALAADRRRGALMPAY